MTLSSTVNSGYFLNLTVRESTVAEVISTLPSMQSSWWQHLFQVSISVGMSSVDEAIIPTIAKIKTAVKVKP
jgi:hypothetical protein